MKKYKVKSGAIIKIVPAGSLNWYIAAKWNILGEVKSETKKATKKKESKKVIKDDKTDTKEITSK